MKILVLSLSLFAVIAAAADNLYRWVDETGRVHYSDQPPPPRAKNAIQKNYRGSVIETGETYGLRQAKERFPVTLYTSSCGPACEMGQQLLDKRGIPYATKDVENNVENQKALRELTGNLKIPTLVIGSQKLTGFEDGQWNNALDAAGYPKTAAPNAAKSATPKTADKSPPAAPQTKY
jgi:glutaredoxin